MKADDGPIKNTTLCELALRGGEIACKLARLEP